MRKGYHELKGYHEENESDPVVQNLSDRVLASWLNQRREGQDSRKVHGTTPEARALKSKRGHGDHCEHCSKAEAVKAGGTATIRIMEAV